MPNSCLYCKFVEIKKDRANFSWYCCELKPSVIKTAYEAMKGCNDFVCYDKEEKEESHGEEEGSAKDKKGSNALQSDRQKGLQ